MVSKTKIINFFLLLALAILPNIARATSDEDLRALYGLVGNWYTGFLLPIGTILAGIVVLIGGIMYISSAGDSAKIGRAKELIFGALTGLVLLVCAALIIRTLIS